MADPIRVLHVDDDPGFAGASEILDGRESERFDVERAADAAEGLDRLVDGGVDCVVSGYDLPGRDGVEFLRAVRRDHPRLPFILVAGEGSEAVASEAISAGVTDYLRKAVASDRDDALADRIASAVERFRAERQLRRRKRELAEVHERIETALETTDAVAWVLDAETGEVSSHPSARTLYGSTVDTVDDVLARVHPDDRQRVEEAMERGQQTGEYAVEFRIDGDDGTRWIADRGLFEVDEDGTPVHGTGIARDVTDRKRHEETLDALYEAREAFMEAPDRRTVANHAVEITRSVLDKPINAVWLYDEADDALVPAAWSESAEELLGEIPSYTGDGSVSWRAFETGEARLYDDLQEEGERYNPETPIRSEMVFPLAEYGVMNIGSPEPGAFDDVDASLVRILAGVVEAALARADRERRLRERRSELERKNERLEEFASIVSHDLRNPLNVADGRLELARSECESDHLDDVSRMHDRMYALISDLLMLARQGDRVDEREPVDLASLVEDCWQGVETGDATLVIDVDRTVRADPDRVRQLLENLIRNCVEHGSPDDRTASGDAGRSASGDGTTPDRAEHTGDDGVTVTVGALDGGFYVEDDGPGIPTEERDEAFERGYSTTTDGTGFGLAIVDRIAEAHGWEVTLTEGTEGGARVEISGVESAQ